MKNAPVNENFRLRTHPDGILEVAWTNLQTGLVMRKSTGTRDESTARAEMSRIAADARTPKDLVKITVGDLIARYLKAQATTKSPHQLATLIPMAPSTDLCPCT